MFIEDSWSFFRRGAEEIKEGLKDKDALRIRDGAEKLWNAVVSAANALVLSYTDIVPASHWERRKLLDKVEEEDPEVEKLGLRDRYGARERYLHEMTFYDGIIDPDMLRREMEKVKKFIEDVQRIISSRAEVR
jgi:stalled ribosome rescue protein Dom34